MSTHRLQIMIMSGGTGVLGALAVGGGMLGWSPWLIAGLYGGFFFSALLTLRH